MPWPSGMPPWEEAELTKLSAAGSLSGLNPLILAGVAQNESGWEVKGAGINPSGYGGYYGLGEHSTYSYNGQSITITPAIDSTNSPASFDTQSEAAALEIQSLLAGTGGDLNKALSIYVSGDVHDLNNTDYQLAEAALGGNPASGGNTGGPITATLADQGTNPNPTANLTGLAGFLQQFDAILNPSGPGGITGFLTGGTVQAVETVAIRGIFTIAFIGLGYLGIKILTGGKGGSNVISIVQRSQSLSTRRQNAATNAQDAQTRAQNAATRANPPTKKSEHTSTRVNRREGGFTNQSTVTHITVPQPKPAKPKGGKVGEAATAVAEGALLA